VEFIGTLVLMLAVNLNGGQVYTCLVLFTLIMLIGDISGGHMNPLVTIAVFIEQKKHRRKNIAFMLLIFLAQALGALTCIIIGFLIRTYTSQRINKEWV
jgi:glycerol uptake facilitator-like aquaporin